MGLIDKLLFREKDCGGACPLASPSFERLAHSNIFLETSGKDAILRLQRFDLPKNAVESWLQEYFSAGLPSYIPMVEMSAASGSLSLYIDQEVPVKPQFRVTNHRGRLGRTVDGAVQFHEFFLDGVFYRLFSKGEAFMSTGFVVQELPFSAFQVRQNYLQHHDYVDKPKNGEGLLVSPWRYVLVSAQSRSLRNNGSNSKYYVPERPFSDAKEESL